MDGQDSLCNVSDRAASRFPEAAIGSVGMYVRLPQLRSFLTD